MIIGASVEDNNDEIIELFKMLIAEVRGVREENRRIFLAIERQSRYAPNLKASGAKKPIQQVNGYGQARG